MKQAFSPFSRAMEKTAGIIIIGNEILSGKIADENSPFLCRELRSLGVNVRRTVVLPDDVALIADLIRSWNGHFTWIFTCGGVGPTHDDVTMAGIARGLDLRLVRSGALIDLLDALYPRPHPRAIMKLTEVPQGARLHHAEGLRFPIVSVSNIYILPGIPELVQKKFGALRERFRTEPFHLRKVYLNAPEIDLAEHLSRIDAEYPAVDLGSYPALRKEAYQVVLTLESKDGEILERAYQELISLLPSELILKTE